MSAVMPEAPDGSILFTLPGGGKYEFSLSLVGKPITIEDKKKALARIRELDLKAVSLRRNLAGHGFEGFHIEDDETEVYGPGILWTHQQAKVLRIFGISVQYSNFVFPWQRGGHLRLIM